jgi:hypothetical protein
MPIRDVSATFRAAAEASSCNDIFLIFATITHSELTKAIRVVNDNIDYQYGGEIFKGCPFDITLLSDNEAKPTAKVGIQNVDQEAADTLDAITDAPRFKLEVIMRSQFSATPDLTLNALTELGVTVVDYLADLLRMAKVRVDAMAVTADLMSWDYGAEPLGHQRATKNRLPGLYWQ